jgi:hypothetical protein
MTTIEKEFFRTQREAGIHFAPWAENAELQRAAGVAAGVAMVGITSAVVMMLCAYLLRLLAGGA